MPRKLMIFICLLFTSGLLAQEESPLIVFTPVVSSTVFTNWQMVTVTYTVGYLDGYELLLEEVGPEKMSFSPFEPDLTKGQKIVKINQRRYKEENYFDLVYHLRIVDQKKGEILIPEQLFKYVKREPGKSMEGLDVRQFKSPPFMFRYDSVLTKNADDIMDEINFGSFKNQAMSLKTVSISSLLLGLALIVFVVFGKPVSNRSSKGTVLKDAPASVEATQENFTRQQALTRFIFRMKELVSKSNNQASLSPHAARTQLCNELRSLFTAYVPELVESDTHKELVQKLNKLQSGREKELLYSLENFLRTNESVLYGAAEEGVLIKDMNKILEIAENLAPSKIVWFNFLQKTKRLRMFGVRS